MTEPTIEVEPRSAPGRGRRAAWRRWMIRGLVAVLALALLPLGLTILYLPSVVRPLSTLMVLDLASLRGYDRQYTYIDDMGPHIVNSVMMSEDGQFCSHRGVDWGEMSSVLEDFRSGGATRGASTIPMQTVKNLYLWHGRSYVRKGLEIPLAIYFDAVTPKKRIMEIYLNIAEWGPGIYGAEAAAQAYFGKPVRDLTRRQAALMAVTLPSPATRNPARPGPGMSRLAATVERRAAQAGGYNGCVR